jgi:hypothetical protein
MASINANKPEVANSASDTRLSAGACAGADTAVVAAEFFTVEFPCCLLFRLRYFFQQEK